MCRACHTNVSYSAEELCILFGAWYNIFVEVDYLFSRNGFLWHVDDHVSVMLVKIVFIVSARCLALAWRLQLDAAAEREHKPHRQTQQEHHKAHQQQQLHRPLRSQCVMETASRLCCLAQAASCSCLLNCSEADKFYYTHHRVAYNVSLCKATYE